MRLGILGGTFDPIHYGHLRLARYCIEKLILDKIYFIPAGNPPHKKPRVSYEQRVHMMRLALASHPQFDVNELEKHKQARDYTYTYYTLKKLREEHPDDELFFLMGEDNVSEISTWFRFKELLNLAEFVIISRKAEKDYSKDIPFSDDLTFLEMPNIDISSKQIRNLRVSGKSIHGLVPDEVEKFIINNSLYT